MVADGSSTTNGAGTGTGTGKRKKKVQKWCCENCQKKIFVSFEECAAHEAMCQGTTAEANAPMTVNDAQVNLISQSNDDDGPAEDSAQVKAAQGQPSLPIEAESDGAVDRKKRPKRLAAQVPTSTHPFFQGTQRKGKAAHALKSTTNNETSLRHKDTAEMSKTKQGTTRKKTTGSISCLNAFFQGATAEELKAIEAEQKIAEFQAKRRQRQEIERERRLKKQKTQTTATITTTTKQSTESTPQRSNLGYVRFPIPSHVIPKDDPRQLLSFDTNTSEKSWWNPTQVSRTREGFQKFVPWDTLSLLTENHDEPAFTWNTQLTVSNLHKPDDFLLQALSAVFIPTKSSSDKVDTVNNIDISMSDEGQELFSFLNKWKDIREESRRQMDERHMRLAGRKKKRAKKTPFPSRKSKYNDEEDWFLSGSDTDEEGGPITSLFLLTGDIGAGKTSLVYKVAEKAHCGVLEVNTSEVRGASALRKRIQEVTQTHSAKWNRKANLFPTHSLKEAPEEDAAALTIILIDEVDLLFPTNGDNGFWSALSDVSKKAKAPIVLTANRFPDELQSPVFRLQHVHLKSSNISCALFLKSKALSKGLSVRSERKKFFEQDIKRIAFLAKGDYRRISLAMDVLKTTSTAVERNPIIESRLRLLCPTEKPGIEKSTFDAKAPRVNYINPRCLPADDVVMQLATITGTDFLAFAEPPSLGSRGGYPVRVHIGMNECPHARILDDNTIVAVCPAIEDKWRSDNTELPWEVKFVPISITTSTATGRLGTTFGAVERHILSDGTPFATLRHSPLVQYCRNGETINHKNTTPGQECDFVNSTEGTSTLKPKVALQVLTEGIEAWLSQKHEIAGKEEIEYDEDEGGLALLEQLSELSALDSDAALFEDCGLEGAPALVGGCVSSVEKADKTFLLQRSRESDQDDWIIGSNAFMTQPSAREARLLKRMANELRGRPHRFAPSEDDDDPNTTPVFREDPDDDALLPSVVPIALHALPGYLRSFADSHKLVFPCYFDVGFSQRQREIWDWKMDLVSAYVFQWNQADLNLFFSGLKRDVDCLLEPIFQFDPRLALDYFPLISGMAVLERAYEFDFNQASHQKTEESGRGRSTRSSTKKGREHYFETAFEYLRSLHNSDHAHEVGRGFAQGFLCY